MARKLANPQFDMEKHMYHEKNEQSFGHRRGSRSACLLFALGVLSVAIGAPGGARAATIVVDTENDSLDANGDCSLREAIQAANSDAAVDGCTAGAGADTITVPDGTFVLGLTGAGEDGNLTGDLDIYTDMTIEGAGATMTSIRGDGSDRVFDIASAATVEIRNVTVRDGHAPDGMGADGHGEDGGGVRNQGDLTLRDCIVNNNRAGDGGDALLSTEYAGDGGNGGGVFNGGTLELFDCELSGNRAGHGGESPSSNTSRQGDGGDGGAIASSGVVVVNQSVITSNVAGSGGGAGFYFGRAGNGGGISSQSALIVENTTISNNDAGDGSLPGRGGGIDKSGSGLFLVRSSLLVDNQAGQDLDSSSNGQGGAIYALSSGEITNSTLAGNVADYGAGLYTYGSSSSSAAIHISHSTIVDNLDLQINGHALYKSGSYGYLRARNSIVLGNIGGDCSSSVLSAGFNLFGSGSSCPDNNSSDREIAGTELFDAVVHPLAYNGGATLTYALRPGSLAVDAGVCTDANDVVVDEDQRAAPRPSGSQCDIGAFEAPPLPEPELLIATTDEPPGANCGFGGLRLDAGLDNGDGGGIANDGDLQAGEIDRTIFECDDGSGAPVLVAVSAEPEGVNCVLGGTRIASGQDDNGNGTLDDAEIDAESYVCTGAGTDSLVKVVEIEPGSSQCEHGGQRIDVGSDDDRDGDLDDNEIESTSYVCRVAIADDAAAGGCNASGHDAGLWLALFAFLGLLGARRRQTAHEHGPCERVRGRQITGLATLVALAAILGCGGPDGVEASPDAAMPTADAGPSAVLTTNVEDGDIGVSVLITLTAQSSVPLVRDSVNDTTVVLLDSDRGPLRGQVSYDDETQTLAFQPAVPLVWGRTYQFLVQDVITADELGVSSKSVSFTAARPGQRVLNVSYDVETGEVERYTATRRNEAGKRDETYVEPGLDAMWFTEDDVMSAYAQEVMDTGLDYYMVAHTDPGADGQWLTEDDPVSAYARYQHDESGRERTVTHVQGPGPDGEWMTDDDVISYMVSRNYQDGRSHYLMYSFEQGPDGVWGTGDDTVVIAVRFEYFAGVLQRLHFYSESGADQLWGTEDDIVDRYTESLFDERGELVQLQNEYKDAGTDGIWYTDDDTLSSYWIHRYDERNQQIGSDNFRSGPDGEWMTADDEFLSYWRSEFDELGNRTDYAVMGPGPDGVPFNEDDIISLYYEYETPDAGARSFTPQRRRDTYWAQPMTNRFDSVAVYLAAD